MKKLVVTLVALTSFSALADSYKCDIAISKGGESIGTMQIEQDATGTTVSNRLYSLPVSKKKNIFGKTVKEVEIVLIGAITAVRDPSEGALNGEIAVATTTETRKRIHTDYQSIAKIDVSNDAKIDATGSGYSVFGSCNYIK